MSKDTKKSNDFRLNVVCESCGASISRSKYNLQLYETILCRPCRMKRTYSLNPSLSEAADVKRKKTCLDLYGKESVAEVVEFQEKWKQTKRDKYGNEGFFQAKGAQDRVQKAAHSMEAYAKRRHTCKERYGVEHHMQCEEVQKNMEDNYKEKTGFTNPMHNPEVIKKIVDTYGRVGGVSCYCYSDIHFDSSWEIAFYIWLTDNKKKFIYHPTTPLFYVGDDDREHAYYPDFLVEGVFYEIKGSQFFDEAGEPFNMYTKKFWREKYDSLQRNNVKILRQADMQPYLKYVRETYGTSYLKQFKIKKSRDLKIST